MKDYFVTNDFVLNLENVTISYNEQSSLFKDTFFTKYSFPFDFNLNRDLRIKMGNYANIFDVSVKKKHDGYHVLEGKKHKAVLEILEVQKNRIKAQIDSGFENLPNWDTPLEDLPLDVIKVDDIYNHANSVCKKKYPEVFYNFPQLIYKEKEEGESWKMYEGCMNNRDNLKGFIHNNEMEQDFFETSNDADKLPKNRNIITPMPYLLYVLKKGFLDSGFELKGDILTDKDFYQRVIYPGRNYYFDSQVAEIDINIQSTDYEKVNTVGKEHKVFYKKQNDISVPGKWRLSGFLVLDGSVKAKCEVYIEVNGKKKMLYEETVSDKKKKVTINKTFFIDNNLKHTVFVILETKLETFHYQLTLLRVGQRNESGDLIPQFVNSLKEVNLKRAVPDMTFGDLVTIIKNWKNYYLFIKEGSIFMNLIKPNNFFNLVDFKDFEVDFPLRRFNYKHSFLFTFPKVEGLSIDTVFISDKGVEFNKKATKNTSEISINGYCLPIVFFKNKKTARVLHEDPAVLTLVYYDGITNGNNFANNPKGLMPPDIQEKWKDWYFMRVNGIEVKWSFIANKNKFRHIDIYNVLFAYKQRLLIKEILKTSINEKFYKVDITTEVVR